MDERIAKQLEDFDRVTGYYLEDPTRRSITKKGECKYNGPRGRKCAAAYWASLYGLKVPAQCEGVLWGAPAQPFPVIPGVPVALVVRVQQWHDRRFHWHEGKETIAGEAYRESIRKSILAGVYA